MKRITFQEFAPGLEHLDLVNSGIREIDKVVKSIIDIRSKQIKKIIVVHILRSYVHENYSL